MTIEISPTYVDLKKDFWFKKFFEDLEVVKEFLNSLIKSLAQTLSENDIQQLLPTASLRQPYDTSHKQMVPDAIFKDEQGNRYLFEMQRKPAPHLGQRLLLSTAKTCSTQLKKGETYEELKKVTTIAFLDYIHFPKTTEYITSFKLQSNICPTIFIEGIEIIIIELPKFREKFEKLKETCENPIEHLTDLEGFLYYLEYLPKAPAQELDQLNKRYPKMKEALKELTWTPEEEAWILKFREEMLHHDQVTYEKSLRKEVQAEEKARVAKSFFMLGVDKNTISKATGFGLDQLEALLKEDSLTNDIQK